MRCTKIFPTEEEKDAFESSIFCNNNDFCTAIPSEFNLEVICGNTCWVRIGEDLYYEITNISSFVQIYGWDEVLVVLKKLINDYGIDSFDEACDVDDDCLIGYLL